MVLQSSGTITASNINTELGNPTNTLFSLNSSAARTLAGKLGDKTLIKYSDFYGKSNGPPAINVLIFAYESTELVDTLKSSMDVVTGDLGYTINTSYLNTTSGDISIPYDSQADAVLLFSGPYGWNANFASSLSLYNNAGKGIVTAMNMNGSVFGIFANGYTTSYRLVGEGTYDGGVYGYTSQSGQSDNGTGILQNVSSVYLHGQNNAFGTTYNGATKIGAAGNGDKLVAYKDFGANGRRLDLNMSFGDVEIYNDTTTGGSMRLIINALLWASKAI